MNQSAPSRSTVIATVVLGAALAVGLAGAGLAPQSPAPNQKSAMCAYLPDLALTPGLVDPRLTDDVLKAKGFTTGAYRPPASVTDKIKVQAMRAYGIAVTPENMRAYELDHAIPISEGGASDIRNLWPELWSVNVNGWDLGAATKDRLEDRLMLLVRAGKMTPSQARSLLMPDWTKGYLSVFGSFPPYKVSP